MARFVLVHGAWHGSWCFGPLAAALRARGHEIRAVDLPCEDVAVDQRGYAALVGPCPDAIVVGHSLGAQTVALVEARTRVYLAGVLPVPDAFAECFSDGFGGTARDEFGRSYWPDVETCAAKLYPECARSDVDWAFPQLRRQAPIAATSTELGPDDVVIATRRDAVIDGGWQVRTARAHGARLAELDSGHSPFLTQPDELADLLGAFA